MYKRQILDVANASKNEVDDQLALAKEDERTHYKVWRVSCVFSLGKKCSSCVSSCLKSFEISQTTRSPVHISTMLYIQAVQRSQQRGREG